MKLKFRSAAKVFQNWGFQNRDFTVEARLLFEICRLDTSLEKQRLYSKSNLTEDDIT